MSESLKFDLKQDEIILNIKNFIVENFLLGNSSEMTTNNESFMENGVIDSTGILELIEYVEEAYEICIEDHELIPENLDSLENISTFIIFKKS